MLKRMGLGAKDMENEIYKVKGDMII